MSAAIQSPNLSMGGRLELSHRVYSLLVNLLVYDSTPRDFLKGSENAGDGSMNNFFPFFIIPWAFNGTMPWISIRDHPLGLVHFIYCPSFSFAWWKTSWQRPCILVKKGTFVGPVALWCALKMWLINWLLKLDLSQQEVLSPPFQVGIIPAVQAVYDPPLLLGSGLRLNDWSSALRLASHPIFHLIALSSLRESVKVEPAAPWFHINNWVPSALFGLLFPCLLISCPLTTHILFIESF